MTGKYNPARIVDTSNDVSVARCSSFSLPFDHRVAFKPFQEGDCGTTSRKEATRRCWTATKPSYSQDLPIIDESSDNDNNDYMNSNRVFLVGDNAKNIFLLTTQNKKTRNIPTSSSPSVLFQDIVMKQTRQNTTDPKNLNLPSTVLFLPPTRTKTPKQQKKQVSFCANAKMRRTITLNDYSSSEKLKTWWTKKDYESFHQSCAKQVQKMNFGIQLNGVKYCSRGLEGHTRYGKMAKCKARIESVHAVLDTQEQWHYYYNYRKNANNVMVDTSLINSSVQLDATMSDVFCRDDDLGVATIAYAYRSVTSSCQLWAYTVGLADAREAARIN